LRRWRASVTEDARSTGSRADGTPLTVNHGENKTRDKVH
jgi:hypothetical protein